MLIFFMDAFRWYLVDGRQRRNGSRLLPIPAVGFAFGQFHLAGHRAVAQLGGTTLERTNGGFDQLPSCQATSTSKPPRARSPFTLPVGHALGSAGSSSISDFRFEI